MKINNGLLIFLLLILSSCGYHFGQNGRETKTSVCVPYITGDVNGLFTEEIVKKLTYCPSLNYNYSNAETELNIQIIKNEFKQIGYKYDFDGNFKRRNNIRAVEGREIVEAEVKLINTKTNQVILGPYKISEFADFDYVEQDNLNDLSFINNQNQRTTVLSFSLGQLESVESAKSAAMKPLFKKLAEKIVDAISTRL